MICKSRGRGFSDLVRSTGLLPLGLGCTQRTTIQHYYTAVVVVFKLIGGLWVVCSVARLPTCALCALYIVSQKDGAFVIRGLFELRN